MEPRISTLEFLAVSAVFQLEPGLVQSGIDRPTLGGGGRAVRAGGQPRFFPKKTQSQSFSTFLRPLDDLRQHYARGEISRKEFTALREDLQP